MTVGDDNTMDAHRLFAEQARQAALAARSAGPLGQGNHANMKASQVFNGPAPIPLQLTCLKCGAGLETRALEVHDDNGLLGARRGFVIGVAPCQLCIETLRRPLSMILDLIKNDEAVRGEIATHVMLNDHQRSAP